MSEGGGGVGGRLQINFIFKKKSDPLLCLFFLTKFFFSTIEINIVFALDKVFVQKTRTRSYSTLKWR